MNSLDSVSRQILLQILESPEPHSSGEISARLGITKRMVRYRLELIKGWLKDRGVDLVVKPNYGIGLDVPLETRKKLLKEIESLTGYQLILSAQEREQILIFSLLTSDAPLNSAVLTEDLGVSRTTLYKDLDRAGSWFFDNGVILERKPRLGIYLEILEFKRRVLLESFLLEILGEMTLLSVSGGSTRKLRSRLTGKIKLQKILAGFFADLDLEGALQSVKHLEQKLDLQLTDSAYSPLAFQIAFQAYRISQGYFVNVDPSLLEELRDQPVFQAVTDTQINLAALPEKVSYLEATYLSMQILSAARRYTVSSILEGSMDANDELQDIVKEIVQTASAYLHPSLVWDAQLYQNLAFHLQTTLARLKYDLPIRNPHLGESRSKYPYIHKVARICCVYLSSQTGRIIPEEEIGKITIHLAAAMERLRVQDKVKKKVVVICGEGISTAWLVISRLNALFPEIEVLEIMSWTQVSERGIFPGDMDGMISTVPLEIPGIPIVQVSPLLTDIDQENIRRTFQSGPTSTPTLVLEDEEHSLAKIIRAEHIRVNLQAADWPEVVRLSGQLLLNTGNIEECYIQAMIDALEQHGPYMVVFPKIALLHASPAQGVHRLGLSMVTLQQPVKFGHPDHDPVQLAITLAAADSYSHVSALMELIELLRDKTLLKAILNAGQPQQVVQAFQDALAA